MRILLLYGGWSRERELSLMEAQRVEEGLRGLGHAVTLLDPLESMDCLIPEAERCDIVYVCLKDVTGTVEALLDRVGCPRTGTSLESLILAKSKVALKLLFEKEGIPTPPWETLIQPPPEDWEPGIPFPLVAKPDKGGSSIGVFIVHKPEELPPALDYIFNLGDTVVMEPYLKGVEIACGVLGEEALPPILIRPRTGAFFDYDAKYIPGKAEEIAPAPIDPGLSREIQRLSLQAHRLVGLQGCSRADFIVENGRPLMLEINSAPGMTVNSLVPKEALAAGITYEALMARLLDLGLQRSARSSRWPGVPSSVRRESREGAGAGR
jgi:D-alanine-D-alanine ligase